MANEIEDRESKIEDRTWRRSSASSILYPRSSILVLALGPICQCRRILSLQSARTDLFSTQEGISGADLLLPSQKYVPINTDAIIDFSLIDSQPGVIGAPPKRKFLRSDQAMGCDMMVALGRATVDGHALFGQNADRPIRESQSFSQLAGHEHAADEKVRTPSVELPQARLTYTVLAAQPAGYWGYTHGVNDQGVAAGCAALRNKIPCPEPGLSGTDLVRLVLERSRNARSAVDLLIDLVERHGQNQRTENLPEGDTSFLVADATEAFAVETAGRHWVCQEIREVRAASDVCLIRQDWDRISQGLADFVIRQGWWPGNGSKVDFAGAVTENPTGAASGLRRWGRATLLLEQQNGHIDAPFLRRVLSDHYEGTHFEVDPFATLHGPNPLCQHGCRPGGLMTATSMVSQVNTDPSRLGIVWCAFGPPCYSVYFPLFLEGELPEAFRVGSPEGVPGPLWRRVERLGQQFRLDPQHWASAREAFSRLQAHFDQEAEEFAVEGGALKQQGTRAELHRLAGSLMQHHVELFEAVLANLPFASPAHPVSV
jgi:dipeptidase